MKFVKILFSKTILVVFAILVQLAVYVVTIAFFNEYFFAVQIASLVLGFATFIHLINKRQTPEFKLTWMLILLTFTYFGISLYLTFSSRKLTKKQTLKITKFRNQLSTFYPCPEQAERIKTELGSYRDIENYLKSVTDTTGHFDNRTSYFKSGEAFFEDLTRELAKAEKFIFMEYFIISYGAMWDEIHEILLRKVNEGVEVRILYDDIGSLGLVKSNFYKKLRKEGIKCVKFNPFRPILSGIHNNRDHRKITVIDGVVGYTGGINISDEYINVKKRFGYWKDNAVKIEGSAVSALTALFLQLFDGYSKKTADYGEYIFSNYPKFNDGGFIHCFGDSPAPFDKELVGENNFINIINRAENYVYITTPYLIINYNLTTALRNAAFRGVDVRIITPRIPDKKVIFNVTRSHYKTLLDAGVKIYEFTPGFIHAKTMLADDKIAFVGTINLDYRSLVHHFECGATLFNTPCINDIKTDLVDTMNESEQITVENYKMNKIASLLNSLLAIFFPLL